MSYQKISQHGIGASRFAERITVVQGPQISTPLAKVMVREDEARAWRITLGRPDRSDQQAPLVAGSPSGSSPIFQSSLYPYTAGIQFTPVFPPTRDNPVARAAPPGNDLDPVFVEIAWGMSTGAIKRMIAHWPMLGASLVVYGSYVEVFAGTHLLYGATSQADIPIVQADITPTDGLSVSAAGELSIQQVTTIGVGTELDSGSVFFIPDYAREVRVVVQPNDLLEGLFHPPVLLTWWDDRGPEVIERWMQGAMTGAGNAPVGGTVAPDYQRVPSRATVLQINLFPAAAPLPAYDSGGLFLHWRLAP